MVKKLFKHEFLAYARVMSVVYIILFTIAAAGRAIQFLEADSIPYYIIFTTSLLTYGVCVYGVIGFTVVMAVIRFYKHLFSSEGYLSFTLPVTTTQHIIVKVVTAVCMEIITLIMVLLSGCILSAGELLLEIFKALIYLIQKAFELAGPHTIAFAGELSVLFLLECFSGIMLYYTCICIGQLFSKHRILAAVGAYAVYYILAQIVATVFSMVVPVLAAVPIYADLMIVLFRQIEQAPFIVVHFMLCLPALIPAVAVAVEFIVVRTIITKRLNLE